MSESRFDSRLVGPDIEQVAVTITRQVRMRGWQSHHSTYLLSMRPIDRDLLVDALPQDVLVAMSEYGAGGQS